MSRTPKYNLLIIILCSCLLFLSGCAGTIIGTAADAAIEIAKVPFKVAGAAIDVMSGDDDDDNSDDNSDDGE